MLLNKSHSNKNQARDAERAAKALANAEWKANRINMALNILNSAFTGKNLMDNWYTDTEFLQTINLRQAYRFFHNKGDIYSNGPSIAYDWDSLNYIERVQTETPLRDMTDAEKEDFALVILNFLNCRNVHYDTDAKLFIWQQTPYTPSLIERIMARLLRKKS